MSITILNYHDQALVDQINAQAAERAAAKNASDSVDSDFATTLDEASQAYETESLTLTDCSEELSEIFEEAASTYGVSVKLLKAIARAESNFNPNAVSSAGAIGIMQLMPATAASLGVSNSYDPRENIMGGAKLISQLLSKYNGDTSLALAAYNAGSGNVDKYGGIPPFTETQNYVKKVLSYMNAEIDEVKSSVSDTISNFLASNNVSSETVELLVSLIKLVKEEAASAATTSTSTATTNTFTVTVADGSNIISTEESSSDTTSSETVTDTQTEDTTATASSDSDSDASATEVSADASANASTAVVTDETEDTTVTDTSDSEDSTALNVASTDASTSSDANTDTADTTDASGAVSSTDTDSDSQTFPSTDTSSDTGTEETSDSTQTA